MGQNTFRLPVVPRVRLSRPCAVKGCKIQALHNDRWCYMHADTRREEDEEDNLLRYRPFETHQEWTYFVMAPDVGLVKIGRSDNLWKRFRQLELTSPTPLVMWVAVKHFRGLEGRLHEYLAAHRYRGEWFLPHEQVLETVEVAETKGAAGLERLLRRERAAR